VSRPVCEECGDDDALEGWPVCLDCLIRLSEEGEHLEPLT